MFGEVADASLWPPIIPPSSAFDPGPLARNGCPLTEPSVAPCDRDGVTCTYGDSLTADCRREWMCINGLWGAKDWPERCEAIGDRACGGAPPVQGASCCATRPVRCEYQTPGVVCDCDPSWSPPTWDCRTLDSRLDPACPERLPNRGQDCDVEGLECEYDLCVEQAVCMAGRWIWNNGWSCPVPAE